MKTNFFDLTTRLTFLAGFILVTILLVDISPAFAQRKKKKKKEAPAEKHQIILTNEDETSRYRILIPSSPTDHETKAAHVLQDYVLQISGTALPIIKANKATSPYEIVLGQNERLDELDIGISLNDLKKDGFLIKTDSLRLVIAGGSEKGTLFGVYAFLEDYLGCRMYSPAVKVIPEIKKIAFDEIHDLQVPSLDIRTTHYKITWDAEYIDWHKLSHDENGGRPDWGMWVLGYVGTYLSCAGTSGYLFCGSS
jgi:hypothetical protein